MKIAWTCLIFAATATYAYAAVAIYLPEEKPAEFADQEGCYIGDLNRVLPYDEPFYPRDAKSCVKYTCQRSNNQTQLVSCGASEFDSIPSNCRVVQDYSHDYPKCCKNLVCDTTEPPSSDCVCDGPSN